MPEANGPARLTLLETTVTDVGDVRVGCGNFWERTWTDPDGAERSGLSAKVAPFDREDDVVMGQGSHIEIAGSTWVVAKIHKEPGALGHIELERRS